MAPLTDAELWSRTQRDDTAAFGELYQRHGRAVQTYCLWRTVAQQIAEETTSTVFLEVWRRRGKLELRTESAVPLLLGVATNVLRNHWRSQRRHARALERIKKSEPRLPAWDEDEVIARVDAMAEVREAGAAIRALPSREREVLALLAWGELSYAETAAALSIPIGTVRSRVSRARSRLGAAFIELSSPITPAEDVTS